VHTAQPLGRLLACGMIRCLSHSRAFGLALISFLSWLLNHHDRRSMQQLLFGKDGHSLSMQMFLLQAAK